jgi:hypothetical protein
MSARSDAPGWLANNRHRGDAIQGRPVQGRLGLLSLNVCADGGLMVLKAMREHRLNAPKAALLTMSLQRQERPCTQTMRLLPGSGSNLMERIESPAAE